MLKLFGALCGDAKGVEARAVQVVAAGVNFCVFGGHPSREEVKERERGRKVCVVQLGPVRAQKHPRKISLAEVSQVFGGCCCGVVS